MLMSDSMNWNQGTFLIINVYVQEYVHICDLFYGNEGI